MPLGELYINNKDAYKEWGVSLKGTEGLSALLTPSPNKELLQNKSRLNNGKSVITAKNVIKIDERDITLPIQLSAPNEAAFFVRYASFCEELAKGRLDIKTKYQPNVVYHTDYLSCQQFSQFMRGIASFTLRLNEPNPANRS